MYDFANSGYTTVVITAIFNAYFVAVVASGAPWATLAWTAALAVSYALILFTAPLLGAWGDAHAAKKRLLAFTTVGCVLGTAGLAQDWSLRLAMGLQLGGAVGNLIDRLTLGYVTDFISVGNFPVFNVADSSISVGVAILILGIWLKERQQPQPASPSPGDASSTPAAPSAGEIQGE